MGRFLKRVHVATTAVSRSSRRRLMTHESMRQASAELDCQTSGWHRHRSTGGKGGPEFVYASTEGSRNSRTPKLVITAEFAACATDALFRWAVPEA